MIQVNEMFQKKIADNDDDFRLLRVSKCENLPPADVGRIENVVGRYAKRETSNDDRNGADYQHKRSPHITPLDAPKEQKHWQVMESGDCPFRSLYLVVYNPLSHDPPMSNCICPLERWQGREAGGHSRALPEPTNRKAKPFVCFCACL